MLATCPSHNVPHIGGSILSPNNAQCNSTSTPSIAVFSSIFRHLGSKGAPETEKKTVCRNRLKMRLGNWILKVLRSHNENWVRYWPFYPPVGTFFPLIFFWCISPLRIFFEKFLREIWTNYHVILPYIDEFDPYKVIGAWFTKTSYLTHFLSYHPKTSKNQFPILIFSLFRHTVFFSDSGAPLLGRCQSLVWPHWLWHLLLFQLTQIVYAFRTALRWRRTHRALRCQW